MIKLEGRVLGSGPTGWLQEEASLLGAAAVPQQNDSEGGALYNKELEENTELVLRDYLEYVVVGREWLLLALLVAMLLVNEGCNIAILRLYGQYLVVERGEFLERRLFFMTVGLLLLLQGVTFYLKYLFTNWLISLNNLALHRQMVACLSRGTLGYFDSIPIGRIINRTSSDISVLDQSFGFAFIDMVESVVLMLSIMVNVFTITPVFIAPCIVLVLINLVLYIALKPIIIAYKDQELRTKSDVFDSLGSSVASMRHIHLLGQEAHFIQKLNQTLEATSRANNAYWFMTRVYTYYMSLISNLNYACGLLLGIPFNVSQPGQFGSSIAFLSLFTETIMWMTRQALALEALMVSAKRIGNMRSIPVEDYFPEAQAEPALTPGQASIAFQEVVMRYRSHLEPALRAVSFSIRKGEKVGIVGRTGAGKSSIFQALFRLVSIEDSGSILVNGRDIRRVDLKELRSNFGLIPQSPFLFNGTVRENLDLFGEHSEEEIEQALRLSGLWDYVCKLPEGMNAEIKSSQDLFSLGQKQLVCLARCLLKKAEVLLLDEATANVDHATDHFIQQSLKKDFKDCTILTIAHRLSTVADYDRIVVLDKGRVAEMDSPRQLLRAGGIFAQMAKDSGQEARIRELAENDI